MAALTSPGVGITVNVSRRDSQEYLRLHQLEPYLEDAAVYALYAEDDLDQRSACGIILEEF